MGSRGPSEDCPLALLPLSHHLGLSLQSSFHSPASGEGRSPGSGPVAFTCFPVHPLPPSIRAAKPVPLPDCDSQPADLSSQRSLSPPRGRLAPLPLPEPGALEARPGQAWRLRPRGAHRPESCRSPWAQEAAATTAPDIQASHLTPRPPPIWSAGRLAAMRLPWAASLCSLAWGPLILGLCNLLAAFQPPLVREGLCRWVGAGR